jgi:hypothetical protein
VIRGTVKNNGDSRILTSFLELGIPLRRGTVGLELGTQKLMRLLRMQDVEIASAA